MSRQAYCYVLILGLATSLAGGAPQSDRANLLFPPPSIFRLPSGLIDAHSQSFQRSQSGGALTYDYRFFATPCIQEYWIALYYSKSNAAKYYKTFVRSVQTFVAPAPARPEPKRLLPIRPPITSVETLIQTGTQNLWAALLYQNVFFGIAASTGSQSLPFAALPGCTRTVLRVAKMLVSRTKAYAAKHPPSSRHTPFVLRSGNVSRGLP